MYSSELGSIRDRIGQLCDAASYMERLTLG